LGSDVKILLLLFFSRKWIRKFLNGYNLKIMVTQIVFGTGHDVTSMNTTVVVQAANIIIRTQQIIMHFLKTIFVVGNGNINNADLIMGSKQTML
jgi:hypothetical protein